MANKNGFIERLSRLGSNPSASNHEGYTALHLASMYSKMETLSLLLDKDKEAITKKAGAKGQNCLHLVASRTNHSQASFRIR